MGLKFCNLRFNFKFCFKNSVVDAFWAGLDIRVNDTHKILNKIGQHASAISSSENLTIARYSAFHVLKISIKAHNPITNL